MEAKSLNHAGPKKSGMVIFVLFHHSYNQKKHLEEVGATARLMHAHHPFAYSDLVAERKWRMLKNVEGEPFVKLRRRSSEF